MGEPLNNGQHVPFKINYFGHNSTEKVDQYTPHNPTTIPCNEAFNVSLIKCSIIAMYSKIYITVFSISMLLH